ncbi:MAG: S8 family serine peptidase [Acidobacteriota bacterium]
MKRRTFILSVLWAFLLFALSFPQILAPQASAKSTAITAADEQTAVSHYILTYDRNTMSNARALAAVTRAGGVVLNNLSEIGALLVTSPIPEFAATMRRNPGVKASKDFAINWLPKDETNGTVSAQVAKLEASPYDAFFLPDQWNLYISKTVDAWAITEGNPAIKVAVLDSGICAHHQDLIGKVRTDLSTSFITEPGECANDQFPVCADCPNWEDRNYHGSHVAGTIATNSLGTAGVAPNVQLIAVKVLDCTGSGTWSSVLSGIMYAANVNADVINMSLGAFVSKTEMADPEFQALYDALGKAIQYAQKEKGCLLVTSAGNDALNLDTWPGNKYIHIPSQLAMTLQIPGISVGATTSTDALAHFSNYGVTGETLTAPGGGLPASGSTPTQYILAPCSCHSITMANPCASSPGWYLWIRGTSMSTPHVSGAAALIAGRLTIPKSYQWPVQIRQRLLSSSDDLGYKGRDPIFGYGRLNTLRAVQ